MTFITKPIQLKETKGIEVHKIKCASQRVKSSTGDKARGTGEMNTMWITGSPSDPPRV